MIKKATTKKTTMRAAEIDVEAMVESKSPATSFERFAYLNVSRECCGGYLVGVTQ